MCNDLERLIQDEGPETVSAFITEPVTGAANAGAYPHNGYFERIREICDEYDVLFIVDEVMAGFGRTGENFAIEHWDVTPDIITGAKGMSGGYCPIGGTMPHRRVAGGLRNYRGRFQHGHTSVSTSGVGRDRHGRPRVHGRSRPRGQRPRVGAHLQERCEEFDEYDFVGDVRGKGLMIGVEFVGDRETKEPLAETGTEFQSLLFEAGLDNGIVTYPGGGHVDGQYGDHVLITPPLTIDDELPTRSSTGCTRPSRTWNRRSDGDRSPGTGPVRYQLIRRSSSLQYRSRNASCRFFRTASLEGRRIR